MAVHHFAATFDPSIFMAALRTCTVLGDQLDLDALHTCAKAALVCPSDVAKEALRAMRYCDSWIEAPDDETDLAEKWLMIVLTQDLSPAPSLGHQSAAPHVILRALLADAGMAESGILRLCHGDSLGTLLQDNAGPWAADQFHAIRDFGGWLSPALIKILRQDLDRVRGYFFEVGAHQKKTLAHIYPDWEKSADSLCRQAYASALEMLDCAQHRKQALFMVLD